MAGGGADELARFFGEQVGDGAGVLPLQRLAGQDHRAGIDVASGEARLRIGLGDELGELGGIDGVVGQVRRQQNRRLPQHAPVDHHEPAR